MKCKKKKKDMFTQADRFKSILNSMHMVPCDQAGRWKTSVQFLWKLSSSGTLQQQIVKCRIT